MRSRFIATLTGALLISGCAPALQDAPRGASVAAPIAWRTQLGVPAPVEAQWWQRFGDPQMSALVERLARTIRMSGSPLPVSSKRAPRSVDHAACCCPSSA